MNSMGNRSFLVAFFLLQCLLDFSALSQTVVHRRIAQRHDDFSGNAWQGVDSTEFFYNARAALTLRNQLKANGANWDPFFRYTFTLDNSDRVTVQLRENWISGNWTNNTRYSYSYDASGNVTEILYDVWNGTTWAPTGKIVYSGYSNGLYTDELVSNWSGGAWANMSKTQRIITNGKVQSSDKFNWNTLSHSWKKFQRLSYAYNQDSLASLTVSLPNWMDVWTADNRTIHNYSTNPFLKYESLYQSWDTASSAWINNSRISYVYTPTNQIDLIKTELWSGAWQDLSRHKYLYNASDELSEDYRENFSGAWSNDFRNTYSYTGTQLTEIMEYSGNGSAWTLSGKKQMAYNALDSLIFMQKEMHNGSTFEPVSRDFYYYQSFTVGLNDVFYNKLSFELFPVPTQNQLNILLQHSNSRQIHLEVLDFSGRILQKQTQWSGLANNFTLDVESLPKGLYMLRVTDLENQEQGIRSFLKQ